MKILAIVPARGGSKGIPRKNLVNLCGKPLILWSVEFALKLKECGVIAKAILSTDDAEIKSLSEASGIDAPFVRPTNLATDQSPSVGYVIHALEFLQSKGENYDAVLILQPTSPRRNLVEVIEAVCRFEASTANSMISCYEEIYINASVSYTLCKKTDGPYLIPNSGTHNRGLRRQDRESTFIRNGAIYLTRTAFVLSEKKLICDRPMLLNMKKSDSVDIDSPEDLEIARRLYCDWEF
jgi:CMP-N,N'-diacetyllegionaminic acid synthase